MPKKKKKQGGSWMIVILLIVIAATAGFAIQGSVQLPDLSDLSDAVPFESTIIYSADGTVLGTIHAGEKRISVPISQISPYLIKAVLASEDNDFFNHRGISLKAIARATLVNLFSGRIEQGGSTITQQLARSLFLNTKKTFGRKLSEMYIALELERKYTKEEILEMYLNQVYWGHNTYGSDTASQIYFGKHADSLTLGEAALLASILGAPEIYSPYRNFDLAIKKRDNVLEKMARDGMITDEQAETAKKEKVTLSMGQMNKYKFNAPYFTTFVINQLVEKYGPEMVYKGGLRIYTTLNMPMQHVAESTVSSFIMKEGPKYHFSQAALLTIDPVTGHILTMVGGSDFNKSEFNRVTQAKRSPGSSFKPFVYTAAMEQGISPGDILYDTPATFDVFPDKEHPDGKWKPKDFDKKFRGPVMLRYALENSLNLPAIKLLQKVGIDNAIAVAHKMGIKSDISPSLSLVLGTSDMSLLEMTSAYSSFATGGVRADPLCISKITDKNGRIIEENEDKKTQVLEPKIAYIMVDMMKGVIAIGTGYRAKIGRPAAAKTGTSDNFRDAWFIGFVPQLITGVWVGNDDNTPMKGVAEVSVCPRIWKQFMETVLSATPPEDFPKPENVVNVRICLYSGRLAGPDCPPGKVKWATFWAGKQPTSVCASSHGKKTTPANGEEIIKEGSGPSDTGTKEFYEETF
ncbi:MAG: penicillin-binding protein 1A [Candidatus Saganbacteria bacterium]|nr:penicillin-binding protein 1A [Candidatus Saganbacteria bacterium]